MIKSIPMKEMKLLLCILFFNLTLNAQEQLVLESKFITQLDTIWVFQPENNSEANDLPLVYLLHGWSGNYKQWNNIINCQEYADKYNCIIVCPDGLYDSWYIDSPVLKHSQYKSFFFNDVHPEILEHYSIDEQHVFITGLSMGGHGALYLFSQQPELFKSAGSISGVLDLLKVSKGLGVEKLLGIDTSERDKNIFTPYSVVENLQAIKQSGKPIIFSCGVDDKYYGVNNRFRRVCDSLAIDATYIAEPGNHDAAYWEKAIACHFLFFKQHFNE